MSTPTSTVSGLVSGIDWDTTIKQLMAIERRKTVLLEDRRDENQTKLSLWAQIQSKVSALQSAMEGMDLRSEFAVKSASSSDSSLVAVTASAAAAEGAHTVEVLQLAKAHRLAAQGWADKNATGVGDSGGDFVMRINGETITIADADLSSATTLEQLRNLINSSPDNNDLVTASILDDGSSSNSYRLVITANATGADNEITITSNPTNLDFTNSHIDSAETRPGWTGTSAITSAGTYTGTTNKTFAFTVAGSGAQTIGSSDITVNWVDSLGNTGSLVIPSGYGGANLSVAEGVQLSFGAGALTGGESFSVDVFTPELAAAQDARVGIDGIYMNRSSNSITDVLDGITLNLLSAEPGTTVDIAIANDTEGVKQKIQGFIDAYNGLMGDLSTYSSYDEQNQTAAPLLGDGFLSTIRSELATSVARAVPGLPSDALYDSLAVIGIRASTGGLLTIDGAELDNALENHFDDVVDLFTKSFTSQDSKIGFVASDQHTQGGEYALVANYDASGNLISATINGQTATIDGLLIHGGQGTSVEGLVLNFTGSGTGPGTVTTTIRYSPGAAGALAATAISINDPDMGPVHFATENLNQTIESLNKQIEDWDERLQDYETQLRREYSQLEALIAQMQSQSNFLTAALG